MTSASPLIWKRHKKRIYTDECPHCGAPLKWIYDGDEWIPCDKEPVLFYMHPKGKLTLVYDRQELPYCLLYKQGDTSYKGTPLTGHRQHYYTCEFLRRLRKDFIEKERSGK